MPLLVLLAACLLLLSGCSKKGSEPISLQDGDSASLFVKKLIEDFNEDNTAMGYVLRDYAYPSPNLAWKHYYCVMDKQYELEVTEEGGWIFRTTYTEYESTESALSPEAAMKLEQHVVSDTFQAVTFLIYQDNEWTVQSPSEVFSQKKQKWTRKNLFRFDIIEDRGTT